MDIDKLNFRVNLLFAALFVFGGALLNIFVISVNGGVMPVIMLGAEGEVVGMHVYVSSCEGIQRCELVDRFELFGFVFSLGDVFIVLGIFSLSFFYSVRLFDVLVFNYKFRRMRKDKVKGWD